MQPTKADLRAEILASRRAVPADVRRAEAKALGEHLLSIVGPGETVCAYVPVGSEPGSPATLDAMHATGVTVLLPVAREDAEGAPSPLYWGEYVGSLVDAAFGLREPVGPCRPAGAIADASTVVIPALAVDRTGIRLGRGAGFYDRTLVMADPTARLIAVIRDDELQDELPGEPHDVAMTHALMPSRGLVQLGRQWRIRRE